MAQQQILAAQIVGGGGNVATDAIWDAKGDLAAGTGVDTAAKIVVGTDGQVLTADSAQTTGLKWNTVSGTGTVTSVDMSVPTGFTVAGNPVTASGTLAVTLSAQSGNKVLSSPSNGSSGTPAFRALVALDIPAISESGVTNLTSDLALKAPIASPTFTGTTTAPEFSASGLTGAVSASRYVGATASIAPTTGTFALGDFVITQTGKIYVCTVAGSPGTWTQVGAGGAASMTIQEVDTSPSVSATTLIFPNGTLTDNGGGTVTYTPAGGAGGMTLISSTTAGVGGVASVTFSGIASSYKNLMLTVVARSDTSATFTNLLMQLATGGGGVDTGANYDSASWQSSSTSTLSESLAGTSGIVGAITAATSPSDAPQQVDISLNGYAATVFHKTWRAASGLSLGTSTQDFRSVQANGRWRNTGGVTSILIKAAAGNLVQDSVVSLWGIS